MNLVITDANGVAVGQTDDFEIDLQYGQRCDFKLVTDYELGPYFMITIDGTPFGGLIDTLCVTHGISGDSLSYEGRTLQGVLASKIIEPQSGSSHYSYSGDANAMLAALVTKLGLSDIFQAKSTASGLDPIDYTFYRYIDGYRGIRMALASIGARLEITCSEGKPVLSAVACDTYGTISSEHVYFSLDRECLPVNHLIGLGKGEGASRAVSHWYANALGEVSQTQTLFGKYENALTYSLNAEEADTLPAKTKNKLLEYQESSSADVKLDETASLDVGDFVSISSSKYNIKAVTQVTDVVLKYKHGVADISYKFGLPDYPNEGEE